jgi:hypothetical protein
MSVRYRIIPTLQQHIVCDIVRRRTISHTISYVAIGKNRPKTYDIVCFDDIVCDIVRLTYDIAYDIAYDIV